MTQLGFGMILRSIWSAPWGMVATLLWGAACGLAITAPQAQAQAQGQGEGQVFNEANFGYRLTIPNGWTRVPSQAAYSALFVPPDDGVPTVASVMVMNLPRPARIGPVEAVEQAAASYAQQVLDHAVNGEVLTQVPFRWDMGDQVIMGAQVVVRFDSQGIPMRQWAVFLPRPTAQVYHLWQFTASDGRFDALLPQAQGMLNSLKPVVNP